MYTECGTLCPLDCMSPPWPEQCEDGCMIGCQCEEGYVINDEVSVIFWRQRLIQLAHTILLGQVCPKTTLALPALSS